MSTDAPTSENPSELHPLRLVSMLAGRTGRTIRAASSHALTMRKSTMLCCWWAIHPSSTGSSRIPGELPGEKRAMLRSMCSRTATFAKRLESRPFSDTTIHPNIPITSFHYFSLLFHPLPSFPSFRGPKNQP